ncbi:MAG: helicase-associated domain-containing protein [Anaerolineae bacterium]
MASLKQILETYHIDVLRAIAKHHGLEVTSSRKAPHVKGLVKILSRPETVKRALADLTPLERRALALIQTAGGTVHSSGLKQTLSKAGAVKDTPDPTRTRWSGGYYGAWYEGNPSYKGTPCYEDLMARLALRGLVFSREPIQAGRNVIEWTPGRTVFIPPAIAQHLPDLASQLDEKKKAVAEPPQKMIGSARIFQRDLGRFWRYIRSQGELRLTTQGYVYKADLKVISETLGVAADLGSGRGEAHNGRLYFIRRLLPDLGLVQPGRSGNLEPVPDTKFLKLSPAERVKRTLVAWRDGAGWNELLHLPVQASGYRHTNPAPAHLKDIRRKILAYVQEMGADGWVETETLIDLVRLRDYGFLFPQRQYHAHYSYYRRSAYATPYYGNNNPFGITWSGVKDEVDGWEKVEGGLIAHIVAGPLHWMGITDLGYPATARTDPNNPALPPAYRLTEMGAWLLGLGEPVEIAEEGGRVVVQPNFQVLAMEPIPDQVLINLDRFAEPQGGDRVMTYQLTRQSVYEGQQQGWAVPKIIRYLEKTTGAPLPGNIRRSLEEWHALHERIVFRRGLTLAQAADEATLDRLLKEPKLKESLGRRMTDTVTLPPKSVKQMATLLRRQGWLPLVTAKNETQAPDSVRADADGRLRFVHAAPSIYALGRVAPFSEPVDGGRQITQAAVRNALRARGVTVDTILEDLQSVHAGKLPRDLVHTIKAWGKYYGAATMDTLTLIQFRDHDALKELLADPELKPYLQPFEAGQRALATVNREHLDTVQRLLADRGIEIKWGLR